MWLFLVKGARSVQMTDLWCRVRRALTSVSRHSCPVGYEHRLGTRRYSDALNKMQNSVRRIVPMSQPGRSMWHPRKKECAYLSLAAETGAGAARTCNPRMRRSRATPRAEPPARFAAVQQQPSTHQVDSRPNIIRQRWSRPPATPTLKGICTRCPTATHLRRTRRPHPKIRPRIRGRTKVTHLADARCPSMH